MKGILAASLVLLVLSCPGSAQAPAGAEARLKALNITLPPDTAPAANFVNSVQTGKLLFLSGNTAGPAWVQIPAHRGQSFRRIADSNPVIADSF
jgi:hypothetical protein